MKSTINSDKEGYLNKFKADVSNIPLPKVFDYPFFYEPHSIAKLAAEQLQDYLTTDGSIDHNFGLGGREEGLVIGKMFGVLVVQQSEGQLGFLAGFSGKLAQGNHHVGFVPPVFDMLTDGSFFLEGEKELNAMNREIELLQSDRSYLHFKTFLEREKKQSKAILERYRHVLRSNKSDRKARRQLAESNLVEDELEVVNEKLKAESLRGQFMYKATARYWDRRIARATEIYNDKSERLDYLLQSRKSKSNTLQKQLFKNYTFLDSNKTEKSLLDIFEKHPVKVPPAGAGECAAPKLFQFAFQHDLKPIALAEFWWGESLSDEVRIHKNYYPCCRGKCEPILGHMLSKIDIAPNPMLVNPAIGKVLDTIYEDEWMVVINKPAEFFSVPGKNIEDSVQSRMKAKYPKATGPLVVHRLDMSTSGIMLIAKSMEVYKHLQEQFVNRSVKKSYVALLDGTVEDDEGEINIPLRLDIDDRPRQMMCAEFGKICKTRYQVIERIEGRTRVFFYPITGRTHQLRVHAAHSCGLGAPIVGDDIYGTRDRRLHLHAQFIKIKHPVTGKKMSFKVGTDF